MTDDERKQLEKLKAYIAEAQRRDPVGLKRELMRAFCETLSAPHTSFSKKGQTR